jgi:predicted DNA-binding mobile mystery protein A
MKSMQQKLIIEQLDRKFLSLKSLNQITPPERGWIFNIRTALKMSLRQLGKRLGISAQSVKEIEQREAEGSLTLKSLREVSNALDMKLVYAIIPKEETLEMMIEKRADKIAREIVLRTSNTMSLEDQKVSDTRIKKAIEEKTQEIIDKMPRYLWD